MGQSVPVVKTDGADRALLCLATHDRTVGGGRLAVSRIGASKSRAPIGWDLGDGDLGLVSISGAANKRSTTCTDEIFFVRIYGKAMYC